MFISETDIPRIPGPSREEWIPVNECLPQVGGNYVCVVETIDEIFGNEIHVEVCSFNENMQKFRKNGIHMNVTHWFPIPEIPKKEK